MSRKKENSPDMSSPPGNAVDFIVRTAIARAGAPGKRQIRPKNVEDLINADLNEYGSDEDPDFDVAKDKHHNESDVSIASDEEGDDGGGGDESGDNDKASMDGNVEDSEDEDDLSYDGETNTSDEAKSSEDEDSDNSNSDSSEEEDESEEDLQSPVQKRSALRETLQKLNEAELSAAQVKRKRKRPRKAGDQKKDDVSSSAAKKKTAAAKSKGKKDKDKNAKGSGKKGKDSEKEKPKPKKKKKSDSGEGNKGIKDLVLTSEQSQKENRKEVNLSQPICSACLGKSSDELNEIVECDSCGITVHEACYGVSDTLSVSSGTGSSCSTEPWFCDACRTGAKAISCELCPMQGGLFKETTAGRWVHLVCALYTPGVRITDSAVPNLFEIPYPRWGAHTCSLCDDIRFARSGICIQCDAGLCKTYLHATCAQKHGLLSDPVQQSESMDADPFFAACKLHTNRETAKRRAKYFATLQEQLRIKRMQKVSKELNAGELAAQKRVERKLEQIRFKIAVKQATNMDPSTYTPVPLTVQNVSQLQSPSGPLPPTWKDKKARLLTTSAGTAISFYRKASLMGLDIKAYELEDKYTRIVTGVKKKWNVPPGLGVEFAAYYGDRENRITNLAEQLESLAKGNVDMRRREAEVKDGFDREQVHLMLMDEDNEGMRQQLKGITVSLKGLCEPDNKKLFSSVRGIELKCLKPIQRQRSPSHAKGRKSPVKFGSKKLKGVMSPTRAPLGSKMCSVCNGAQDQYMIECCDRCGRYYHLKCLDPPLTRMPKRTKLCGWMCSDCNEELEEAEAAGLVDGRPVNANAPRKLRGRTKIRKPGKYRHSTDSREGDLRIVEIDPKTRAIIKIEQISTAPGTTPIHHSTGTNGPVKKIKKRKGSDPSATTPASFSAATPDTTGDQPPKPKRKYVRKSKPAEQLLQKEEKVRVFSPDIARAVALARVKKAKKKTISGERRNELTRKETINVTGEHSEQKLETGFVDNRQDEPARKSEAEIYSVELQPKTSKSQKLKKLSKKMSSVSLEQHGVSHSMDTTYPPLKKRKYRKKSLQQGDTTQDSQEFQQSPSPSKKKGKKARKSIAELQRIMMAAATVAVKKSDDPNNASLNITPIVLSNGKPKKKSKREAEASGSGSQEGESPSPPKKRKKKVSEFPTLSASLMTGDTRVVDEVMKAMAGRKNEVLTPGLPGGGVFLQGIAPGTHSWNGTTAEENAQPIMKGRAMDINCSPMEVVTVNASDLIDLAPSAPSTSTTLTTPAVGSGYSPGFYSSNHDPEENDPAAAAAAALTLLKNSVVSPPMSVVDDNESGAQRWGQGQAVTTEDNFIKLIYEDPGHSGAGTTNRPIPSSPPAYATSVPVSAPIRSPLGTNTTTSTDSSIPPADCSICCVCSKQDFKKNLVTCDKCAQDYHFPCLTPPLKYSPRRRNYAWYCSTCDEDGQAKQPQSQTQTPSSAGQQQTMTVRLYDDNMKTLMKRLQP